MRRIHIVLLIILAVLVVLIIAGIIAYSSIESNMAKQLNEVTISDVDLSKVSDGTYDGSYKIFPVEAAVKVTVENHKLKAIELVKHVNGQGQAAEVLPSKVIEAQSLKVDTISGATISSKVILKSIENALK